MPTEGQLGYVVEPQRKVHVAYDVDVAVVGAGVAGMFAALAAGRQGAETILIDRFGSLGGNNGPAMIVGGSTFDAATDSLPGGVAGIPQELLDRLEKLRHSQRAGYADDSNIISYLGIKMAEEAGVELLLSVWAADPIIEDNRVTGLFVEGKSGRVAVKAKVVIDASADADVARRAGVPVITDLPPDPSWAALIAPRFMRPEYEVWNDTGIYYLMANLDGEAYRAFAASDVTLSKEDKAWLEEREDFPIWRFAFPNHLVPIFRKAWESGEYQYQRTVDSNVHMSIASIWMGAPVRGLTGNRINMGGAIRRDDMKQTSLLESEIRTFVFDTVQFLKNRVPGFENAYLLFIAPYLGSRGGPFIEGEYTLTPQDSLTGTKFDDVLFRNIHDTHAPPDASGPPRGERSGFDVPYRTLIPKGLDGLLATGRASSYMRRGHDPGSFRARNAMMLLGEAAGTAAALAVKGGVQPRNLDVRTLQRDLLKQGFNLGEPERLKALGLA